MSKNLPQAMNFVFDVQELINKNLPFHQSIARALLNYPEASEKNKKNFVFLDGSEAILTNEGFKIKEK